VGPLKIENVIAVSHLGKELELVKLATEIPNAKYSSSGNPSVIVEIDSGNKRKAAGVMFANGKVVVTGIISLNEGKLVMAKLKNLVKAIDKKVNMKRATKIENIVARFTLDQILDLSAIALAIPGCEYDPTRFQGLVLRMEKPSASFILFESGVSIVTDVLSEAKAKKAFNELKKFMLKAKIIS